MESVKTFKAAINRTFAEKGGVIWQGINEIQLSTYIMDKLKEFSQSPDATRLHGSLIIGRQPNFKRIDVNGDFVDDPDNDPGLEMDGNVKKVDDIDATVYIFNEEVQGLPLQDLLDQYSAPVQLEQPYNCERCGKGTDAWKRTLVRNPPQILCIQLLRFDANGQKINKEIDYPPELTIPEYQRDLKDGRSATSTAEYTLSSIIVHEGNQISSGHYVCYVNRSGRWFYTSDTVVKETSQLAAYHQNAYMLFYEKKEQQGHTSANVVLTKPVPTCRKDKEPVLNINT
ncbi:ubiquitin carboxyl-terminal hydrolase 23 [Paramuricea clavata]|uniref:Ubiquitin carboxyl-terminal hydrolase 23 n=1 Tax=Paramuricea clavata TaxID=317549 RepID=A0A7D9H704_PARCT|nr:ubiquitin carboxyl-terminal hydrolase 23 [Paramuricea clavata]